MRSSSFSSSGDRTPIIAQCTPEGSGALALLRLCGDELFVHALPWIKLSHGDTVATVASHTIQYGFVMDPVTQEIVDQVLFFVMRAPKTFTGQDTIEISCHNNKFIIQRIIALACAHGARLALPGEFTKRAVLHGKIDLLQAEAINELIHASSQDILRRSLSQVKGSFSHHVALLQKQLVEIIAFVEASFEFLDEEQRDFDFHVRVCTQVGAFKQEIKALADSFHEYEALQQGLRIALVGPTNAGKSTLFNTLIKKERSIVTDIAGTTRDTIESVLYKNGVTLQLVDTAGLRETADCIEQAGIERSQKEAQLADIILVVLDATRDVTHQLRPEDLALLASVADRVLVVINKIDVTPSIRQSSEILEGTVFQGYAALSVSAREKQGIDQLELWLDEKIRFIQGSLSSPYVLNKRQWQVFKACAQELDEVTALLAQGDSYELVAYHLKAMLESLSCLSGKDVTEEVFDKVFSTFCVGK